MAEFTREPYIIIIAYADGGKMKRVKKNYKKIVIVFLIISGLMTAGYFIWMSFAIRPLKDLSLDKVEKISIYSCGEKKVLNEEETKKMVKLLQRTVCYKAENVLTSEHFIGGGPCIVEMTDKTQLRIDLNPYVYDTVPQTEERGWRALEINEDIYKVSLFFELRYQKMRDDILGWGEEK